MQEIRSITGKIWLVPDICEKYTDFPEIVSRLLINRKINESDADKFINATVRSTMPDPYTLKDMEKSVQKIASCIKNNEKIFIIGDYDVDGVTSTSLLVNYFNEINFKNFEYYIPHRIDDGYGLNSEIVNKTDAKTIITADNGSTAFDALELAKTLGINVVVLDHHQVDKISKNAYSIVNPHRPDDSSNLKILCAAGVVFFFLVALNRYFRLTKFFVINRIKEPNLLELIDLVALGTVCDVMQISGINRAIVSAGIKAIKNTKNLGLRELAKTNIERGNISAETFGFFIGPRLNAAGRLDHAKMSVELLTIKSQKRVEELIQKIEALNTQRQTLETIILDSIPSPPNDEKFIVAYSRNWHPGVIGIVAGRIKEKYNVPSFVISFNDNGVGYGSARSTESYDLAEIITEAKNSGILLGGGGHKLAGGFTISYEKIDEFKAFLKERITKPIVPVKIQTDGYLSARSLNLQIFEQMSVLEPFGHGNEIPRFIIPNVKISYSAIVGKNKKHISVLFEDEFGTKLRGIAFNCVGGELGQILLYGKNKLLQILGTLTLNSFGNTNSVEIMIEDIAYPTYCNILEI